ncbi:MAG: hypothetical protein HYS26_03095 [Candidatus Kaiserbacteria bacterium]|nr:MAG: hypothetical protein HYS26_03095 [Candidatus Kaiserbacteria bacterium]
MSEILPPAQLLEVPMTAEFPSVPSRDALEELRRRRRSPHLKTQVGKYMKDPVIPLKRQEPFAIFFRQVATPQHELLRFLRTVKDLPLTPLVLEYHGDKFVSTGNPYKRSLGKLPVYQFTGSDGRDMVKYRTVVDFNAYTGKSFSDVRCKNGEKFVEFHHRLLASVTKMKVEKLCYDATPWFTRHGDLAHLYYEELLAFFVRDAILFEHFEPTEAERVFVKAIMLPAFRNIEARFGYPPLVVELVPKGEETRAFWDSYPKKIERYL